MSRGGGRMSGEFLCRQEFSKSARDIRQQLYAFLVYSNQLSVVSSWKWLLITDFIFFRKNSMPCRPAQARASDS